MRWTALFPPGRGGGQGVDVGYKGKGCTVHSLCDGNSHPLAIDSTAANGDERQQVVPLLLTLHATLERLFADKGYDAEWLRIACAWYCDTLAIIARRQWPKPKTPDPLNKNERWVVERGHSWRQRKYRRTNIRWERLQTTWVAFLRASLIHYWVILLVG